MQQSALLTLYFAHTPRLHLKTLPEIGQEGRASHWEQLSHGTKVAVYTSCWDSKNNCLEIMTTGKYFRSTQTLWPFYAIWCHLPEQADLLHRILNFKGFEEIASSYFSFFLFKAMEKTGNEHLFLDNLDFWYHFLDRGHTTCGETGFASHDRSDCHAWSAHPAYYMLSIVCGIKPANIGFDAVKIKPHLGELKEVKADMPHPKDELK